MAYYTDPNEEKDAPSAQGMNQTQEQAEPVKLSNTTSSTPAPASGAAPSTMSGPAKPASSGQTGFQNYTKANQGNAQSKLNTSVAQNVSNAGNAASSAINQAQTSFGQKVEQGSLANRQKALEDVSNTIKSARSLQAGADLDQSQQDRFKEVINSRYQGPESLRQSGLYNQASGKVQTAQTALDNTKTATGREDLLRNMYQQRGDYTTGLNKLDSALLNSSQQGVQNLQNIAQQQGNVAQRLGKAEIDATNMAQNRAAEIRSIQENARKAFTENKTAEELATEQRIAGVKDNWNNLSEQLKKTVGGSTEFGTANAEKLQQFYNSNPEYLAAKQKVAQLQKDVYTANKSGMGHTGAAYALQKELKSANNNLNSIVQNGINNQTILGQQEAELLGLQQGQGFYNQAPDSFIRATEFDRDAVVTKDEQLRQAALSRLAGLDLSNRLDANLNFTDAEKAGTKTIMDSYDKAYAQQALKAQEDAFMKAAQGQGNLANVLTSRGYGSADDLARSTANAGQVAREARLGAGAQTFLQNQGFNNRVNVIDAASNQNVNNREAALLSFIENLKNGKY